MLFVVAQVHLCKLHLRQVGKPTGHLYRARILPMVVTFSELHRFVRYNEWVSDKYNKRESNGGCMKEKPNVMISVSVRSKHGTKNGGEAFNRLFS